jgi:hypothetical protein
LLKSAEFIADEVDRITEESRINVQDDKSKFLSF